MASLRLMRIMLWVGEINYICMMYMLGLEPWLFRFVIV